MPLLLTKCTPTGFLASNILSSIGWEPGSPVSAVGNQPFKLVIDDVICRRCRRCPAGEACRGSAFIRFDPDESTFIDMSRCWGCLKCVVVCPFGAVIRVDYSRPAPASP